MIQALGSEESESGSRFWDRKKVKVDPGFGMDSNLDVLSVLELLQIPLEVALCGGPAEKFQISNLLKSLRFQICLKYFALQPIVQ